MSITSVPSVTYSPQAATGGSTGSLDELQKEKDDIEEQIDELKSGDQDAGAAEANLQVLQNKLSLIELKITMEEARKNHPQQGGRERPPPSDPEDHRLVDAEGVDVTA